MIFPSINNVPPVFQLRALGALWDFRTLTHHEKQHTAVKVAIQQELIDLDFVSIDVDSNSECIYNGVHALSCLGTQISFSKMEITNLT